MLFLLNKEKLIAYTVSVLTVVTLLCLTQPLNKKAENIEPTSATTYVNNNNSTDNKNNNSTDKNNLNTHLIKNNSL